MVAGTVVSFVARSTVRSQVLSAVAAEPRKAETLIADLPVSRSGVYKALDELESSDLVMSSDSVWSVTSIGVLVADQLRRHDAIEDVTADRAYWTNHDVSVLPEQLRDDLLAVRDLEVWRNKADDPGYLQRWGLELFRDADRVDAASTIRHDRYADAMDERIECGADGRLLSDRSLYQHLPSSRPVTERRPAELRHRICDLPCSFMVTDDVFTLSLPFWDGTYDRETELVAESEAAVAFGERLFDYYWERATPLREYLDG